MLCCPAQEAGVNNLFKGIFAMFLCAPFSRIDVNLNLGMRCVKERDTYVLAKKTRLTKVLTVWTV
jgi:hypothetical protein